MGEEKCLKECVDMCYKMLYNEIPLDHKKLCKSLKRMSVVHTHFQVVCGEIEGVKELTTIIVNDLYQVCVCVSVYQACVCLVMCIRCVCVFSDVYQVCVCQ